MTATPEPKADRPDPPKKPPTTTATGMADNAAFALVVPIPPGWQVGALELVPTDAGGMTWRRTLQTHAMNSDRTPVLMAACESAIPAHATALAIASAWAQYQSEHPSGAEAAAQAGCRVPHPQPAGGIRTQTVIRVGEQLPIRVTFPNSLTLTATVPELVRLDTNKPPAWYSEAAADTITEHGIFPEPYQPATADVDQMADFLKGRGPVPGDSLDDARRRIQGESVRVSMSCDLSAVAEGWDGKLRPISELTDPTPPELRRPLPGQFEHRPPPLAGDKSRSQEAVQAQFVADMKAAEARLGEVVRTAPGEGFVPAYPVRRRAENLGFAAAGQRARTTLTGSVVAGTPDVPGAWPTQLRLPPGVVMSFDVWGDSYAAPGACSRWQTVPQAGPLPVMLSSFYRSEADRPG